MLCTHSFLRLCTHYTYFAPSFLHFLYIKDSKPFLCILLSRLSSLVSVSRTFPSSVSPVLSSLQPQLFPENFIQAVSVCTESYRGFLLSLIFRRILLLILVVISTHLGHRLHTFIRYIKTAGLGIRASITGSIIFNIIILA